MGDIRDILCDRMAASLERYRAWSTGDIGPGEQGLAHRHGQPEQPFPGSPATAHALSSRLEAEQWAQRAAVRRGVGAVLSDVAKSYSWTSVQRDGSCSRSHIQLGSGDCYSDARKAVVKKAAG